MTSQQFFKKIRKVENPTTMKAHNIFKPINSGSGEFKLELSESTHQSSWLGMCGVNSLDPMNPHSELDESTRKLALNSSEAQPAHENLDQLTRWTMIRRSKAFTQKSEAPRKWYWFRIRRVPAGAPLPSRRSDLWLLDLDLESKIFDLNNFSGEIISGSPCFFIFSLLLQIWCSFCLPFYSLCVF